MAHAFRDNTQSPIGRTLGLGAVAGVRSMSAPALLSRAASRGSIEGIEDTPFAFLSSPRTARILTVLAVGEALADKLPFSPDRISPPVWSGAWPPAGWSGPPCSPPRSVAQRSEPGSASSPPWPPPIPPTTCGSRPKRGSACRTGPWASWRTPWPRARACSPYERANGNPTGSQDLRKEQALARPSQTGRLGRRGANTSRPPASPSPPQRRTGCCFARGAPSGGKR